MWITSKTSIIWFDRWKFQFYRFFIMLWLLFDYLANVSNIIHPFCRHEVIWYSLMKKLSTKGNGNIFHFEINKMENDYISSFELGHFFPSSIIIWIGHNWTETGDLMEEIFDQLLLKIGCRNRIFN